MVGQAAQEGSPAVAIRGAGERRSSQLSCRAKKLQFYYCSSFASHICQHGEIRCRSGEVAVNVVVVRVALQVLALNEGLNAAFDHLATHSVSA